MSFLVEPNLNEYTCGPCNGYIDPDCCDNGDGCPIHT